MNSKIIITGIQLTDACRVDITLLLVRLLRRDNAIMRVRLDLHEQGLQTGKSYHTARGEIELRGRDVIASESSGNLFQSIYLVVDKLERLFAERLRRQEEQRRQQHALHFPIQLPKAALL